MNCVAVSTIKASFTGFAYPSHLSEVQGWLLQLFLFIRIGVMPKTFNFMIKRAVMLNPIDLICQKCCHATPNAPHLLEAQHA